MLKAGSAVFVGKWDALLGSEIVLESCACKLTDERADDDDESQTALRPVGEPHPTSERTAHRRTMFVPVRAAAGVDVPGETVPSTTEAAAPDAMHEDTA